MQVYASQNFKAAYRPDIDGLRAIAVLMVLGYHAFPQWVVGGFSGVDIFFVISGFLISSILYKELNQGTFQLTKFYARRIRRIFPTLALVLVTCLIAGWFLLVASEFKALGKYTLGGAGFVANLFFLHDGGYFGSAANTKPLLHLWSLGVEEQFYIIWPALLWLAYRLRIRRMGILAVLACLSFMWALIPVFTSSLNLESLTSLTALRMVLRTDALASFFLPQSRLWELLLGAAFAHLRYRFVNPDTLSLVGALLVLISIGFLRDTMPYPSYLALLATLGAVFLIAAGPDGWVNRHVLSKRPLVAIGLISYPLYLWHWPILVFAQITLGEGPNAGTRVICLAASFTLACVTYKWVERPLRFGSALNTKTMGLICVMVLIGFLGAYIYKKQGLPHRPFAEQTQRFSDSAKDWQFPGALIEKKIDQLPVPDGAQIYVTAEGAPELLLLGDSHMQQYAKRIANLAISKKKVAMFVTGGGCPAIPYVYSDAHYHCRAMQEHVQRILKLYPSIRTIAIAGSWNGLFSEEETFFYQQGNSRWPLKSPEGRQLALDTLGAYLQNLSKGYRVYFFLDNPTADLFDPIQMIGNRLNFNNKNHIVSGIQIPGEQAQLNEAMRQVALSAGVSIIEPNLALCSKGLCSRVDAEGYPIYQNAGHLTARFVEKNANYVDVIFEEH